MTGSVCKWCGLHEIRDREGEVYFACGSSCYDISGVWEQSTGCVEILDLRQRIADAIDSEQEQRAELVTRFAVAIVATDPDLMMHEVWRMAADYANAKPKIGGES